jgi:hypothetical protein
VRLSSASAVVSVLVHGLGVGLVLARAAPHVVAPAAEPIEVTQSEEVSETPVVAMARSAEVEPERPGDVAPAAPDQQPRGKRPDAESRRGIGQAPIGVDAPDMLEMIQQQIASWDPHLVKGGRQRASTAGEDLPDPAAAVAAIDGVVHAQMRRFRTCHGVGLPGSIGVGGDVRVRLLIKEGGSVLGVWSAGGAFPDEAVRRCVLRAFTQLQFPPPPGGAAETVTYTVSLVAGDVVRAPSEPLDPRRGE